uniref:Uncharacterized protein n=1 Tax=Anguilla anguilla TaxID=7936 RepID=A0A0E9QMC4_ANGAN
MNMRHNWGQSAFIFWHLHAYMFYRNGCYCVESE